jgi:hypothetical protein
MWRLPRALSGQETIKDLKAGTPEHLPILNLNLKGPLMEDKSMSYRRFALMIATSTVVMFGLMYLNTFAFDHIFFSQTRAWMALLMGATMAAVMLAFMWKMYKSFRANVAIVVASLLAFVVSLYLIRSQQTVDDLSYMNAMIPHHSIAIMTSERAHIRDPRVRKLADGIIEAQVREIGEMKQLIAELKNRPTSANAPDLPPSIKR